MIDGRDYIGTECHDLYTCITILLVLPLVHCLSSKHESNVPPTLGEAKGLVILTILARKASDFGSRLAGVVLKVAAPTQSLALLLK